MKKLFIFCLLVISSLVFAQKYSIMGGVSFPMTSSRDLLTGGGTVNFKTGFLVGINRSFEIKNNHEVEIGVYYQNNKTLFESAFYPNMPIIKNERSLNFIYFPIQYKYSIKNYFFVKGGPIISLDSNKKGSGFDNYSGLGIGMAIGKDFGNNQYKFRLMPYANAHSLIYNKNKDYFIDMGIQFGLTF